MGLDMFLEETIYIGAEYEHRKVTGSINISVNKVKQNLKVKNLSSLSYRVAYWRKANSIHNWFVNECQGGIDECQRTNVYGTKLLELVDLCNKALSIINDSNTPCDSSSVNVYLVLSTLLNIDLHSSMLIPYDSSFI